MLYNIILISGIQITINIVENGKLVIEKIYSHKPYSKIMRCNRRRIPLCQTPGITCEAVSPSAAAATSDCSTSSLLLFFFFFFFFFFLSVSEEVGSAAGPSTDERDSPLSRRCSERGGAVLGVLLQKTLSTIRVISIAVSQQLPAVLQKLYRISLLIRLYISRNAHSIR